MSGILFLDDSARRTSTFLFDYPSATCVETAAACIAALKDDAPWNVVCLDHDLGGETFVDSSREDCGMEVVRWIEEHQPSVKLFVVHTYNPGAAGVMVDALIRKGYRVIRIPFRLQLLERTRMRFVGGKANR